MANDKQIPLEERPQVSCKICEARLVFTRLTFTQGEQCETVVRNHGWLKLGAYYVCNACARQVVCLSK